MGCSVSSGHRLTMSFFGRKSRKEEGSRTVLERKLYIAKESPDPEFDLSACHLKQVPSGVYSICKVFRKDKLYLQDNNLHSLEDGGHLSDLYLLKTLNISNNKFHKIPDSIRYLVNITELYIQGNEIKALPDSIEFLQSLHILDVSNNNLKQLTPSFGKLKSLRILNISKNSNLIELCSELCYAANLVSIELDSDNFIYPPSEITANGTEYIMKYLCEKIGIDYIPPLPLDSNISPPMLSPTVIDPFKKKPSITWEEQEAAIIEQENKIHETSRQQREKFLSKIIQDQQELDTEIAKVHEAKEFEKLKLIKSIQDDELKIESLVNNFKESAQLRPEVVQQQLAYDQAEHDRILEITRLNYDNIRKTEVLKAMETLIEENFVLGHSKKNYSCSLNDTKQNMLMEDLNNAEKLNELLKAKDQSRTAMMQKLLEDQDIQKAAVASLVEKVDAKSWSINQEISLISSHLARLSVIEQEKKKLNMSYNYNELLHQRFQLVNLLDDLLDQKNIRRKQLIQTLKDMEDEEEKNAADFWLKNYQRLMDSAPKNLLEIGRNLDPVLANYLLQEGVIHCLPFLVKFLFSEESLANITLDKLRENGVSLPSDRDGILRAINSYVESKVEYTKLETTVSVEPTAPVDLEEAQNCTGVVTGSEVESMVVESECVICMDAKCEMVFIPCGHMCCCQECADKGVETCPMCRNIVERKIKVVVP